MTDIPNISAQGGSAPFAVGSVLSHAFEVFGRATGKFLVLAFIPLLPVLVVPFLGFTDKSNPAAIGIGAAVIGIVTMIAGTLANAMTLFGAFREMRSEDFTIGESFRVGLKRFFPIIGLAIVVGIAVGLATMLLIVPGLILLCMWYVAVPACIIEGLGVGASMSRSRELTRGYRWQVFGLVALILIATMLVSFIVGYMTVKLAGAGVLSTLANFALQVISTAFGAVLSAIVYHDLRVAKEGVDVSKMAKVFD